MTKFKRVTQGKVKEVSLISAGVEVAVDLLAHRLADMFFKHGWTATPKALETLLKQPDFFEAFLLVFHVVDKRSESKNGDDPYFFMRHFTGGLSLSLSPAGSAIGTAYEHASWTHLGVAAALGTAAIFGPGLVATQICSAMGLEEGSVQQKAVHLTLQFLARLLLPRVHGNGDTLTYEFCGFGSPSSSETVSFSKHTKLTLNRGGGKSIELTCPEEVCQELELDPKQSWEREWVLQYKDSGGNPVEVKVLFLADNSLLVTGPATHKDLLQHVQKQFKDQGYTCLEPYIDAKKGVKDSFHIQSEEIQRALFERDQDKILALWKALHENPETFKTLVEQKQGSKTPPFTKSELAQLINVLKKPAIFSVFSYQRSLATVDEAGDLSVSALNKLSGFIRLINEHYKMNVKCIASHGNIKLVGTTLFEGQKGLLGLDPKVTALEVLKSQDQSVIGRMFGIPDYMIDQFVLSMETPVDNLDVANTIKNLVITNHPNARLEGRKQDDFVKFVFDFTRVALDSGYLHSIQEYKEMIGSLNARFHQEFDVPLDLTPVFLQYAHLPPVSVDCAVNGVSFINTREEVSSSWFFRPELGKTDPNEGWTGLRQRHPVLGYNVCTEEQRRIAVQLSHAEVG